MQGDSNQELPFYKVRDISVAWNLNSKICVATGNSLSPDQAKSIKAHPIPTGTIIFAKIGEALRLNRSAILPKPALIDNNVMGILGHENAVDQNYLYWFTTITRFDADARASVVPSIRKSDVADIVFSLPPFKEQTRIVEKLEELFTDLDAGVAELKAAQKKLAQYRQSLLKAAVTGELTAEWRASVHGSTVRQAHSSPRTVLACEPILDAVRPEPVEGHVSPPDHPSTLPLVLSAPAVHPSTSSGRTAGAAEASGRTGEKTRTEETETGAQLLERILKERRTRWEEKQLARFKEQGKTPPKGWQDKYPEPVQPDTANLPELPEGWVWASVDQCSSFEDAAITDGPFGSNLKSAHYTVAGPRVIRLKNIGEGVFVDAEAHISEAHYQSLKKHAVETDDVVVAMLGEDLPRACLIPMGFAPGIVKADCARIRVNSDVLLPDFLNNCLNSQNTKQRVSSLIKGIGRPRINLTHVRGICIPLPSLTEQTQIVSVITVAFDEVSQQLDAIQHSLTQAAAQRKNILKSAFSGQLVPQDPNDEPASMLLERIRAERGAQGAVGKRGRKTAKLDKKVTNML
jgi:type I restriction enzyme S subunit